MDEKTLDSLLEREDTLYANRVNFFLLLQSMLFFSYVTSMTFMNNSGKFIGMFINVFALVITSVFLIIFARTIDYIHYLRDKLKTADPKGYGQIWDDRKKIWENRTGIWKYIDKILKLEENRGANNLLGIILPILFFVVWFILLICSLFC